MNRRTSPRRLIPILVLTCGASSASAAEPKSLPERIETTRGSLHVEDDYLPGVVSAQMTAVVQQTKLKASALVEAHRAVAIVARTRLLSRLYDQWGSGRLVPLTGHFQPWSASPSKAARDAVKATRGQVLVVDGVPFNPITVPGAWPRNMRTGEAYTPDVYGYGLLTGSLIKSWSRMRRALADEPRLPRWRWNKLGRSWTELYVTRYVRRGEKHTTPRLATSSLHPGNRGAMSAFRAAWLSAYLQPPGDHLKILRDAFGLEVEVVSPSKPVVVQPPQPVPPRPTTPAPLLNYPTDLWPNNGQEIRSRPVVLKWKRSAQASGYQIQVHWTRTKEWRRYFHYTVRGATRTSKRFFPFFNRATYRFRVRSVRSPSAGDWSEWATFRLEVSPRNRGRTGAANPGSRALSSARIRTRRQLRSAPVTRKR